MTTHTDPTFETIDYLLELGWADAAILDMFVKEVFHGRLTAAMVETRREAWVHADRDLGSIGTLKWNGIEWEAWTTDDRCVGEGEISYCHGLLEAGVR